MQDLERTFNGLVVSATLNELSSGFLGVPECLVAIKHASFARKRRTHFHYITSVSFLRSITSVNGTSGRIGRRSSAGIEPVLHYQNPLPSGQL